MFLVQAMELPTQLSWYNSGQNTMKVEECKMKAMDVKVDVKPFPSTQQCDTESEYSSRPQKLPIIEQATVGNRVYKIMTCSRKRQLEVELREPLFVKAERGATMWVSWPYPVNEMRSSSSSMEDSTGDSSSMENSTGASSCWKRSRREVLNSEACVSHCGRDCSAYVCLCGRAP